MWNHKIVDETDGLLRVAILDRPHLVLSGSGVIGRLLIAVRHPPDGKIVVQLKIDKPLVAAFCFNENPGQTELSWDDSNWQTPRTVTVVALANNRAEDADTFAIVGELRTDRHVNDQTFHFRVPGVILNRRSEASCPESVLPQAGFFSTPYGSDYFKYDWTLQRETEPVSLAVQAFPGSVVYVSLNNETVALVRPSETVDCRVLLPQGKKSEVYLDAYADSRFGLRHSRYTFTAYNSGWRKVADRAEFCARDGASALEFKGKLWLFGGWDGVARLADIWNSEDGRHWTRVTKAAPWEPRHGSCVLTFKDKLWLIGGDGYSDIWNSDDGVQWQKVLHNAPWGKRYLPNVAVFAGRMWLYGGQWWADSASSANALIGYNDVWSSTDGVNWTQVTKAAPWSPRSLAGC